MPTITTARAARHEALYLRLVALEKQVTPIAGKKPELALPGSVLGAARDLLVQVQALLGKRQKLMGVPGGGMDYATLGIALAEARTALDAFEAAHTYWDHGRKCLVWVIEPGEAQPVKRLLPPEGESKPAPNPESERARKELTRLIIARYSAGYDQGYQDASEGKPPSGEYAERVWEAERKRQRRPY